MTIKVTFEFETADEAVAFIADNASDAPAEGGTPAKRTRGRPRKEAATPAPMDKAAAAASLRDSQQTVVAATPATASAPTVAAKDVVDALTNLADLGGEYRDKAIKILAEFGATSFGKRPNDPTSRELDPKFYAAAKAKFEAAMPPSPAATSLI